MKKKVIKKYVMRLGVKLLSAEYQKVLEARNRRRRRARKEEREREKARYEEWMAERKAEEYRRQDAVGRYGHLRPEDRPSWARQYFP